MLGPARLESDETATPEQVQQVVQSNQRDAQRGRSSDSTMGMCFTLFRGASACSCCCCCCCCCSMQVIVADIMSGHHRPSPLLRCFSDR